MKITKRLLWAVAAALLIAAAAAGPALAGFKLANHSERVVRHT
jgi:hypothetical protein